MMNKIKLYTLEGCSNCKKVVTVLKELNIEYETVDCTSPDSEECDCLEDEINCGRYPMASIQTDKTTLKLHLCEDNSKMSKQVIAADSVDKFVSTIIKYYI